MDKSYCSACGQEVSYGSDDLTVFLTGSTADAFNLGRKTLSSVLHLIGRPGELTNAFLVGKRARYTKPLQLYLFAAALFFVANSIRPFAALVAEDDPSSGLVLRVDASLAAVTSSRYMSGGFLRQLEANNPRVLLLLERYDSAFARGMPLFMIGAILVFAVVLALFNPSNRFLTHLVFSLHWIAFFMLLMATERLMPAGLDLYRDLFWSSALLVHLVFSVRRVYLRTWLRSCVSGIGLFLAFGFVVGAWITAAVGYAFRQAGLPP